MDELIDKLIDREDLVLDFLLREMVRIGHSYQILISVINENKQDIPTFDREKAINRLLLNLDSLTKFVVETFDPGRVEKIENEIIESYKIVSEEADGK